VATGECVLNCGSDDNISEQVQGCLQRCRSGGLALKMKKKKKGFAKHLFS
jgi:hypothetical protein